MSEERTGLRSFTVVAAVIRDGAGRVLLTRRQEDRHMGGLWEFPGGKVQLDEAPEDALRRELEEELGIIVSVDEPVIFATHDEPGLRILLLFFAATIEAGAPVAREGQKIAWVPPSELAAYPTPPADARLVDQLAAEGAS
jgi:8-oxo-dGTP diphosphatase